MLGLKRHKNYPSLVAKLQICSNRYLNLHEKAKD
jgi:hypothetical protein